MLLKKEKILQYSRGIFKSNSRYQIHEYMTRSGYSPKHKIYRPSV